MKKRIVSLLLLLTMLLTIVPTNFALAEEESIQTTEQPSYSEWAFEDLVVGDTYGIYPETWYSTGMQKPINKNQCLGLIIRMRHKILDTDCVIDYDEIKLDIHNKMTVKEVLKALYELVASYEFDGKIGIKASGNAIKFMAENGIFTGNEGELSIDDICTVEQACVIATRLVTHIYNALEVASKGFLWEIKSGDNTVYLLGSIHMADFDIYPFSNKMLKAFAEADALGVEVNTLNPAIDQTALLIKYAFYNDGSTLKDHISEETYQLAVEVGNKVGITEDIIGYYKPWALYLTFDVMASVSANSDEDLSTASVLGIDSKFLMDAYLTGKPIIELESMDFQYNMLDSFSDELQEFLLINTASVMKSALEGNKNISGDLMDNSLEYWKNGDVDAFLGDRTSTTSDEPETVELSEDDKKVQKLIDEFNYKMLTQRDEGMADKIDKMLQEEGSKTYFIVVGSSHYLSDYSILDMLKEKGYEINQIK